MKKRWGWQALILVGLFGGVLLLLILPLQGVQGFLFSPGKGVHNQKASCIECHSPFSPAPNCTNMACHPALQSTYKSASSFQFHQKAVVGQPCTDCHVEHTGQVDSYASRHFEHNFFPPAQNKQCESCHTAPGDTLHKKIAQGTGCLSCHTTTSWKGTGFAHNALPSLQLKQCESCHAAPKDNYHPLYTNQCLRCHRVSGWKSASFSHNALSAQGQSTCGVCHRAPQDGKHRGVGLNCSLCHTTNNWGDD